MAKELSQEDIRNILNDCINIINKIASNANITHIITLSKYDLQSNEILNSNSNDNTLLTNAQFRNELYALLLSLLNYYNANDYYEEKYMMLLLHLIFGINPPNNHSQTNSLSTPQQKIKLKSKHKTQQNMITITQTKMDIHYQKQHICIIQLMEIILSTIKFIELKTSTYNEENDDYTYTETLIEEIEETFESKVNDFFLQHFSLFNQSLHQIIDTLYNCFEYEITVAKDYVLFMEILVFNQMNFSHLVIAKFNRIIDHHLDEDDLALLSLREEADFSLEYDLIKTNKRLKSLEYFNQTRVNNDVVLYEDVKYVNKNFLGGKYKVSEKHYEMVVNKECQGIIENNNGKNKEGKDKEEREINGKEVITRHVFKIKNDIRKLNDNYQRDIGEIKEIIENIQSRFTTNISHLMNDLTELELKNEKYF